MSDSNNTPVLRCSGLVKSFNQGSQQVNVLNGTELTVPRGERLAIIGASGAGKSTLLQLLGGLDQPTEGEVEIMGQSMARLGNTGRGKIRNKHLGFVYQFHHLLPEFTALENVAMPLLIGNSSLADARNKALSLLERVGLEHRVGHKPGEMSGGERQRAAVARALINRPACVLADEPTGNLDEKTASRVFELMLELNQESQTSLVIVTHDTQLANKLDRVLELSGGVLNA